MTLSKLKDYSRVLLVEVLVIRKKAQLSARRQWF